MIRLLPRMVSKNAAPPVKVAKLVSGRTNEIIYPVDASTATTDSDFADKLYEETQCGSQPLTVTAILEERKLLRWVPIWTPTLVDGDIPAPSYGCKYYAWNECHAPATLKYYAMYYDPSSGKIDWKKKNTITSSFNPCTNVS